MPPSNGQTMFSIAEGGLGAAFERLQRSKCRPQKCKQCFAAPAALEMPPPNVSIMQIRRFWLGYPLRKLSSGLPLLMAVSCVHLSSLLPTFTTFNDNTLDECNFQTYPSHRSTTLHSSSAHRIYLSGRVAYSVLQPQWWSCITTNSTISTTMTW